jgi:hypothetical protein
MELKTFKSELPKGSELLPSGPKPDWKNSLSEGVKK